MFKLSNWFDYYETVADLIDHKTVKKMEQYKHHHFVTCYQHSVFVSYVAYRIARRFGLDAEMAARMGLLHDLYLYDSEDKTQYQGLNCFYHPPIAAENAARVVDMSEKEANIIRSHMWPMAKEMPKSREALAVNLADKYCACLEFFRIFHRMKMCLLVPARYSVR